MRAGLVAACAALCMLSGCQTAPKFVMVDNQKTFNISKDRAWSALLQYFTINQIQIKTIEKDSGVIYAERAAFDGAFADCGNAFLAAERGRVAAVNVLLTEDAGGVTVRVNTDFKVVRAFDTAVWTDPCNSTGLIEGQILGAIGAA